MPTKEELTTENVELRARVAELEKRAMPEEPEFGSTWIADADGFVPYTPSRDVTMQANMPEGVHVFTVDETEGGVLKRLDPGVYKVTQVEDGAEIALFEGTVLDAKGDELVEGELYFMVGGGLSPVEGGYAAKNEAVTITEDGIFYVEKRLRVRDAGGVFGAPDEEVLYRYDSSGDMVAMMTHAALDVTRDALAMGAADRQRIEVERDQARNEVQRLKGQIADRGALHGSIDNLPGVAG